MPVALVPLEPQLILDAAKPREGLVNLPPSLDEFLGDGRESSKQAPLGYFERVEAQAKDAVRRLGVSHYVATSPSSPAPMSLLEGSRRSGAGSPHRAHAEQAARVDAVLNPLREMCGHRLGRIGVSANATALGRDAVVVAPRVFVAPGDVLDDALDDDQVIEWWPARELFTGERVFVPAAAVLHPHDDPRLAFASQPVGLSVATTRPEALLRGLLDVIAAHAVAAEHFLLSSPAIDLDTVTDATACELLDRFADSGLDVQVRAITTEVEIPTFYVAARYSDDINVGGVGCELDPTDGLIRALTQATRRAIGAEGAERLADPVARVAWSPADNVAISFDAFPDLDQPTVRGQLDVVLSALRAAGFPHALAVDLSVDTIDLTAVRAIVPGTEMYRAPRRRTPAPTRRSPDETWRETLG